MLSHFIFMLLAVVPSVRGLDGGPLPRDAETLESLRDGLETRTGLLRNVEVRATYHDRVRRNAMRAAPFDDQLQVIEAKVELGTEPTTKTRAYLDILETPDPEIVELLPDPSTRFVRYISTFDAANSKALETSPDGKALLGFISSGNGLRWRVPIPELLSTNYWSPLRVILDKRYTITIYKEGEGAEQPITLSWQFKSAPDQLGLYKGKFEVAPQLGYAVTRSEVYRQPRPSAEWKRVVLLEARNWKSVSGVWLPMVVAYSRYTYFDSDLHHELTRETLVEFENWKLNPPIDKNAFDVDFPDGTWVNDSTRSGASYVKGRITDSKVKSLAQRAKRLAMSPELPTSSSGAAERFARSMEASSAEGRTVSVNSLIVLGLSAAAAVLVLVFVLFHLRGKLK